MCNRTVESLPPLKLNARLEALHQAEGLLNASLRPQVSLALHQAYYCLGPHPYRSMVRCTAVIAFWHLSRRWTSCTLLSASSTSITVL